MEMLLTGRWFDAAEAQRWGLVNRVLPGRRASARRPRHGRRHRRRPAAGHGRDQGDRARGRGHAFQDALNRITKASSRPWNASTGPRSDGRRPRLRRETRPGLEGPLKEAMPLDHEPRGLHHLRRHRLGRHAGPQPACAAQPAQIAEAPSRRPRPARPSCIATSATPRPAPARDPALYREVTERIRDAATDVVLNLTAGMGGDWCSAGPRRPCPHRRHRHGGAAERVAHVVDCRPEICTLDCGTMNFAEADYVMVNTPGMLRDMAARMVPAASGSRSRPSTPAICGSPSNW
jgi:hypothetical protein